MNSNQDILVQQLARDIEIGEGSTIEFKEDYPNQAQDLAKEIAAFASSNAGAIYLGVRDDGSICGVEAVRSHGQSKGKDSIQNRIAGVCQQLVKPALLIDLDFIEVHQEVVVKINVPKGTEPIYYCNHIPYVRNLASSNPATPDQVKELFRIYHLSQAPHTTNQGQSFLVNVISQLSDYEILWFDHDKRQVNPDLDQMLYDIGSTGRSLLSLSTETAATEFRLAADLEQLGEAFESLENFTFYMDGGVAWQMFVTKGNDALVSTKRLIQRALKNINLPKEDIEEVRKQLAATIKELKYVWRKAEKYWECDDLSSLKEALRRLAFNFNRIALLPAVVEEFGNDLTVIAQNVREASAIDTRIGFGFSPLDAVTPKIEAALQKAEGVVHGLNLR